jgi:hypothetical protein
MSKFKKYQEQRNALECAIRKMTEIDKSGLPKSAKEIIQESLGKLKEVKIAQPELEKVTGDFLDPAKVKELLEEATEYKWKVVPDKETLERFGLDDEDYTPKEFVAANFGIEVEDKDVKFLCFYRNTSNRSELCMVNIVCIPGHFQCNWANDRASVGDVLMPNSKFEKFIANIR